MPHGVNRINCTPRSQLGPILRFYLHECNSCTFVVAEVPNMSLSQSGTCWVNVAFQWPDSPSKTIPYIRLNLQPFDKKAFRPSKYAALCYDGHDVTMIPSDVQIAGSSSSSQQKANDVLKEVRKKNARAGAVCEEKLKLRAEIADIEEKTEIMRFQAEKAAEDRRLRIIAEGAAEAERLRVAAVKLALSIENEAKNAAMTRNAMGGGPGEQSVADGATARSTTDDAKPEDAVTEAIDDNEDSKPENANMTKVTSEHEAEDEGAGTNGDVVDEETRTGQDTDKPKTKEDTETKGEEEETQCYRSNFRTKKWEYRYCVLTTMSLRYSKESTPIPYSRVS